MDLTKHGNPTEAWSVGKYAKRSATIHLCSNDLSQTAGHFRFKTTLVEKRTATSISVVDKDGDVREGVGKYPAKLIIQHFDGSESEVDPVVTLSGDGEDNDHKEETKLNVTVDDKAIFSGPSMIPGLDPKLVEDPLAVGYDADKIARRDNILRGTRAAAADRSPYHALVEQQNNQHPIILFNLLSTRMPSYAGDHYLMCIPMHMFPHHLEDYEKGSLDCRDRLAVDYDQDDPDHWRQHANNGYRLELYHSANGAAEADGSSAATFNLVYTTSLDVLGVYQNPATMLEHLVVVRIPYDQYIYNLFNSDIGAGDGAGGDGDYNSNRTNAPEGPATAADATNVGSIFYLADKLEAGGRNNQYRVNIRKMPHTYIQSYNHFPDGQDHCNYEVTIPNTIGYPEHKRCLVQVQSLCLYGKNVFLDDDIYGMGKQTNPVYVGVLLEGVGGQNVYSTYLSNDVQDSKVSTTSLVGTFCLDTRGQRQNIHGIGSPLSFGFDNHRSILDDGVLINSPFGKQIRVRLLNMSNKKTLNTDAGSFGYSTADDINENPTHLTLRILFLDDDDLPDR